MPLSALHHRLLILLALALLIALTRVHAASLHTLPSGSWAAFFLAGLYWRQGRIFALLFAEVILVDLNALLSNGVPGWDWSRGYIYLVLLPTYGVLFSGGRLFARQRRAHLEDLLLLVVYVVGSALLAYLCSGSAFYFLSGRYPEADLLGFVERVAVFFPRHLGQMAFYVGIALVIHLSLGMFALQRQEARA